MPANISMGKGIAVIVAGIAGILVVQCILGGFNSSPMDKTAIYGNWGYAYDNNTCTKVFQTFNQDTYGSYQSFPPDPRDYSTFKASYEVRDGVIFVTFINRLGERILHAYRVTSPKTMQNLIIVRPDGKEYMRSSDPHYDMSHFPDVASVTTEPGEKQRDDHVRCGSEADVALANARIKQAPVPVSTDKVQLSDDQLNNLPVVGRHIKNINAGVVTDIKFRCTFYWRNGNEAFEGDQKDVLYQDDEPLPSGQTINFDKYDMTGFKGQVDELDEQATKCQVTHAMAYRENTQNVPLTVSFDEEVENGNGKHDITALAVNETDAIVSAPQIYVMCVQEGKIQPPITIGQVTIYLRTPRNLYEYLTLHMTYTTDSTITVPAHSHIQAKVIGGDDHFLYAEASSFCWVK